jgi:hypothetical protein
MPYKSKAQEAFFNANRAEMERKGVNVDEWNQASKGMKLPKRSKSVTTSNESQSVTYDRWPKQLRKRK